MAGATPAERRTFQAAEVRLTRDVTPQEITERTGGSTSFVGGGFVSAISYEHTEGLQILTDRPHGEARESLSHLKVPLLKGEEIVVETFPLYDTTTILRPGSVTFVIPIKSEKSQSPNSVVEVTISKEELSYSKFSA